MIILEENKIIPHAGNRLTTNQTYISTDTKYLDAAKSANTRRAYQADFKRFREWCEEKGLQPIPATAAMIKDYIEEMADSGKFKASTIQRHISHISQAHEAAKLDSPTKTFLVRTAMKGIRNKLGTRPTQKKAATATIIKKLCDHLSVSLKGLRDRAILQVGFAGALRRSEIAALNVEDIEFTDEGMTILLTRSKTDQSGQGELIGIEFGDYPYCPVRTLEAWIKESGITEGAVFRRMDKAGRVLNRITDRSIARVIKDAAAHSGFNKEEFSGHSLRRGLITTAKRKGTDEHNIMSHTRHKSVQTMRRYIDKSDVFKANPTKGIWD